MSSLPSQFLKIVVQHARMTDQTHLLGACRRTRSDERATPGANYLEGARRGAIACLGVIPRTHLVASN
jgi:hypothetical protein